MIAQRIIPKPWWLVGLTILPGLLSLAALTLNSAEAGQFSLFVSTTLLFIAIWRMIRWHSLSEFPIWGIIPLGMLTFWVFDLMGSFIYSLPNTFVTFLGVIFSLGILILSVLIILKRQRISRVPAITWGVIVLVGGVVMFQWFVANELGGFRSLPDWMMIAFLLIAGLLLAKKHGLYAILLIIPGSVFKTNFDVEPGIYFWDLNRFWSIVFNLAVPLLFYVITPLWILRARSIIGQAMGLLTPIIIYYVALVSSLTLVSTVSLSNGYEVINTLSIAEPVILLFVVFAFAGGIYGWVSIQGSLSDHLEGSNRI